MRSSVLLLLCATVHCSILSANGAANYTSHPLADPLAVCINGAPAAVQVTVVVGETVIRSRKDSLRHEIKPVHDIVDDSRA